MNEFVPASLSDCSVAGIGETSDELLVCAAQSGNHAAFIELNKRHAKKVLPRIYQITKNWEDAEDVLQDAFMKAFVHLGAFEGRSSFSSWLTRIAINSALMMLRKRRAVEVPIDAHGDTNERWCPQELPDCRRSPEHLYAQQEVERQLSRAIHRLRPPLRTVIQLRQANEYSTKEIAAALGISVAAAKSRLLRAKMALRASML
jgi:RNA polymerase sigma-70 factor (ECF subfamily)